MRKSLLRSLKKKKKKNCAEISTVHDSYSTVNNTIY